MATASGKTILMYAIVYMYKKLIAPDTKTLYVLVPTDELRSQHKSFMSMFENFGGTEKDSIVEIKEMKLFGDAEINVKLTTLSKMTGDES
jgi:superfamily II DNA or RNA helicase